MPKTQWLFRGNVAKDIQCQCGCVYDYNNYTGLNCGKREEDVYIYLFPICPECGERPTMSHIAHIKPKEESINED